MSGIGFGVDPEVKQYRIRLDLTDPIKDDEEWTITVIALVTDKKGDPQPDVEVSFYHNGQGADSSISTDGSGRATKEFSGLKKGNHTFEAMIVGTAVRSRQSKTLKDETPKKPAKLLIRQRRAGNTHTISFQVLTEEDKPVKGAVLEVMDPDCDEKEGRFLNLNATDKNGCVAVEVTFTNPRRVITVNVPGSSISRKIHLFNVQERRT